MGCITLMFCITIFTWFGVIETQNTCKGDLCSDNNFSPTETPKPVVSEHFKLINSGKNLNEKEMYFIETSKWPFSVPADTSSSGKKLLLETSTDNKVLQVFPELLENITSTHSTQELYNSTETIEATNFNDKDIINSTVESTTISSFTTELNIPTTQAPSITHRPLLLPNTKKDEDICFCDIQINQCDVNCCCDEDCSSSHVKVFTKCIENNIKYDSKYCYSSNFIFENNTSYEMVQSNGGLFCIINENLKIGLNYEKKPILTTLETFNNSLPPHLYGFSYKPLPKDEFISKDYLAGSPVWTLQNGELAPFKISHSSVGLLCNSAIKIKYLVDQVASCFYQQEPQNQCGHRRIEEMLYYLGSIRIISSPSFLNITEFRNSSKVCKTNICLGITLYLCQTIHDSPNCITISENLKNIPDIGCWSSLTHIHYQIWHNGSEGITKMEAYIWVKKLPQVSGQFLSHLVSEVKYSWVGSDRKFVRSGNPGYLTGKPILAGKKVQYLINGTDIKKEAIEMSVDPKTWLSVLGSEKGFCSYFGKRIPVNFRENGQYTCSLKLNKNNFSKEQCIELQNTIFKLLISNDVINETKENYFNKFVGTFGNSRVEETGDWVQVLIDSFPIVSSQTFFKSSFNYLSCKNMITDLYIDVVYSNTGSFLAPQAKILGVSFQFGKHKDVIYYCDNLGCENTSLQYLKLSSIVQFIDVTKPATAAFAEPLSLEVKLPHDFFYPFFSNCARSQVLNKFVLVLLLSNFVFSKL